MNKDAKPAECPSPVTAAAKPVPEDVTPPGEGERRAQRGYGRQYHSSAAAIYAALTRGDLVWVGLADRNAGVADDVVLGLTDRVVGHQFKTSQFPGRFRLQTLLLGADGLLRPLVQAWQFLGKLNPDHQIEVRLVTNDYPSTSDTVGSGAADHSAAFLAEFDLHSSRSVGEWRATRWQLFINKLCDASGLDEPTFERFLRALRVMYGPSADFVQLHRLSSEEARLSKQIAALLPQLVASSRNKDRWTRAELLHELGWRDSAITRHRHLFPIGAYVQRNVETEEALRQAIQRNSRGYLSLVGPPGAGKSTLLQTTLLTESKLRVARYLAYVPGAGQGIGRGEADDFLEDISTQLKNSGLAGLRFRDETLAERREQFGTLLFQAGERYKRDSIRTLIVVDGLDHVPREEKPARSLLAELPLPNAVPEGVLVVLGTQRVDLDDLKPAVRDQAGNTQRQIAMQPLKADAIHRMADLLGLDAAIPRQRLFEISHGHPLVARYVIEALRDTSESTRAAILSGTAMPFEGDIEALYESAWRGIRDDEDACNVLGYIARAEGSIPLELLAHAVTESAIERALKSTRHLLTEGPLGWSVFHNSFRLFVISKPRIRLAKPDREYSSQVYRELAKLAASAVAGTPQRWLQLRYLARAGDEAEVLRLAQPSRFRTQLAEGRSAGELDADIRLALSAAKGTHDATVLTRLLLARDEINRRSTALEHTSNLTDALLAVGDLDAAQTFAEEYGNAGYRVVDALLASGDHGRAKGLFDRLEPLQQLLIGRLDTQSIEQTRSEFQEWAQRVSHFHDLEQMNREIDTLSTAGLGHVIGDREEASSQLATELRYQVAVSIVVARPDTEPEEVCRQLRLEVALVPDLLVEASVSAHNQQMHALRRVLLSRAIAHEGFLNVANASRRAVALLAARAGELDVARRIFDHLNVPSIAILDDALERGVPAHMVRAVVDHAQLATLIAGPIATAKPSKHAVLRPLQLHANAIGVLLGRARLQADSVSRGEVALAAKAALSYLTRTRAAGSDEYFAMRQIVGGTSTLGLALLEVAELCGEQEFELVLAEIDQAFKSSEGSTDILNELRREVAVRIYKTKGDTQESSRRLEPLVAALRESTPSEQLDALALFAIAFASIGNDERARDVLRQVHNNSLGYALAPKKDPQYATWREVLVRANAADPARRGERVAFLMRQITGMMQTEGRSSAYRVSSTLVAEAAMHDATTGLAVARKLLDDNAIGWSTFVDALLLGAIKRRSDLVTPCSITWCSLALPFYSEPYYRESHLGEFVETAVVEAATAEVESTLELFCSVIEAESQQHVRSELLQRMHEGAVRRRIDNDRLKQALIRWQAEAPPPRRVGTPGHYDAIESLTELDTTFERESTSAELSYEAPYAFERLARAAGFEVARKVFEKWPIVQAHSRARFLLVDLALDSGNEDYARQLVAAYKVAADEHATWTAWTGGGALRYFRARVRLDGSSVHRHAFEHFVDSVAAGRESTTSILLELDDILAVLTEEPDWPAIWELLAEQLTTTREHSIGDPFLVEAPRMEDTEMIADLFRWALALPLAELQRHAHVGAQRSRSSELGQIAFANLSRSLLTGVEDAPAQGLQILLLDRSESQSVALRDSVESLTSHPDYAVAEAALQLCRRWGLSTETTREVLPAFYQLILSEEDDDADGPTLRDRESGAMRVETPTGWTFMFPSLIDALARGPVTPTHIHHRARMFIKEWGGLSAFGQAATDNLQKELRRLEMRMTFWRPHVMVAARALRYVAGELRRSGLIDEQEAPFLMRLMSFPTPPLPLIGPAPRPTTIARRVLDEGIWRDDELHERWLQGVSVDIEPWPRQDEKIVAEISTFEIRKVRRADFRMTRIRAPFLEVGDLVDPDEWVRLVPNAYWADGFRTATREPSSTIVRRLVTMAMPEIPPFQLIICPNWLNRLGWHHHPENWLLYVDQSRKLVGSTVWWRDSGPMDIEEDFDWGEGVYISVTPSGLAQIEGLIRRKLVIMTHACREAVSARRDSNPLVRTASAKH